MNSSRTGRLGLACLLWSSACGDDGNTSAGTTDTTAASTTTATGTDGTSTVDPTTSTTTSTTSTSTGDTTTTTSSSTTEPAPACGDGTIDDGEECDDGADNGDDKQCTLQCTVAACGDGHVLAGGEECDDGAENANNNACTADCKNAICGDSKVLDGTEECDDGVNNGDDKACTASCLENICGDGLVLTGTEACDDGNTMDGDGCSATCASESCGDGIKQPMEACDDANLDDTDDCLATCIAAMCGDGIVWAGHEDCDDANPDDTDACTTLCMAPTCDDGIVSGAETDLDCGGPDCDPCGLDAACLMNTDCQTGVCTDSKCAPEPRTCKEVLALNPMAPSGTYGVDLDGNAMTPAFSVYCDMTSDGGGWTLFYATTGADGQQPMVSNTEVLAGDPLMFQYYNLNRERKVQLSALSTETLFVRNNSTWLKADDPAFGDQLVINNQTHKVPVMLTANNGMTAPGFMGFATYNYQGGGDFGVTQSPDAATCNGMTMTGFDHHGTNYRMLNCGCQRHYIYSYSASLNDGDAGYDSFVALGSWAVSQANCGTAAAEGGALVFYAAMR